MADVVYLWGGPWEARMRLPHNPPPSPIPLGGAEIIYVEFPQHRIIRPPVRLAKISAAQ